MSIEGQDRSDKGRYSLPAMWSIDPELARGGRKFRIDTWPLTYASAIIPLGLAIEVCKYCNCVQDMIQKKLLQRHAKDKRGHREGRSSSKQDTASPSRGGRSTRDQVTVPKRKTGDSAKEKNDTEQSWSHRKAGPSITFNLPI